MVLLKNLLLFIMVVVFTIVIFFVFGIMIIVIRLFGSQRIAQKTLRFLILYYGKTIIYGFARLLVTVKFVDSSKGKTAQDPCVYVANHKSASDAFLVGVLSGEFVQVVNLWPFKIPILGLCAQLAGYLNIRNMPFDDFLIECRQLFDQKVSIIGFPEGTRSGSSQMGSFRSSLFRVAKENKLKIVPLCILGNEDKPKRNSLKINPGRIEIHKLPALAYHEYQHMTGFELKNHVRTIIQTFIDAHPGLT